MRIIWAPEALDDRLRIFDYIAADSPRAALAMDELFQQAGVSLTDFPQMGKAGLVAGTRELLPHESYRLFYEIQDQEIWILAIVHTRRQWPPVD